METANDVTREKWKRQAAFCSKHLDALNDEELAFLVAVNLLIDLDRDLKSSTEFALNTIYQRLKELEG
jgi:hypothetical protein